MTTTITIDELTIATPCKMDWDLMEGDESVRHCSRCEKHVYNFSSMTKDEISELVIATEGSFCGRMFRRPDGTVVTAECPTAIEANATLRRPMQYSIAALLALMTASAGVAAASPWIGRKIEPIIAWFFPTATPPAPMPLMGDVVEMGSFIEVSQPNAAPDNS